ncbi:MAG TPA: ABC transporter substrate-binding protein [Nakamurella sp.]
MITSRPARRGVGGAVALLILLTGCSSSTPSASSPSASPGTTSSAGAGPAGSLDAAGCITDFDPNTDYFPVKSEITHATNFSLSYHDSYQVLTVPQPTQGGAPESYVLVKCGAPTPELTGDLAGAQVVTTPVTSLYSGSTTHLPFLVELDQLDALTGVGTKGFISEKQVQDRVAEPDVVEFSGSGTVDAEAVIAGAPDVLVTAGTDDPAYAVIKAAGIPVLANADWLENDPLGRAEYVKYFAALTGTEAQAAEFFDTVEQSYQQIAASGRDADPVAVVPGQPFQGTWFIPGGESYTSRLIEDAGGTTAWADDTTPGSIPTDLETVLAKAGTAPAWLASTTWTTKAEALAEEPRLAEFAAFQSGNVWNAAKDVTPSGGNNFYELGVARPDLVLGDIAAILHPDLAPNHDFSFYLRLS